MIDDNTMAWLDKTQGLIEPEEGRRLAELAAQTPREYAIVEIGSHTGLSTCWMAAGSRDGLGAHITAVDPYPPPRPNSKDDPWELGPEGVLARFMQNVQGTTQDTSREDYRDLITLLRTTSEDAARIWTKGIALLFVDAIHEEAAVKADYTAWMPHVVTGGFLAFHDYGDSYPGCKAAIDWIATQPDLVPLDVTGTLWVGRKLGG